MGGTATQPVRRIGVDLGGTKIEALALDEDGGELLRRRVATPTDQQTAIVRAIAGLVASVEQTLGCRGHVGVATPGAISPANGLLKNSNTVCLNGTPLDRDLSEALQRPVRLANDADCFALSEATDGAAAGLPVVFGVIVGTGTGGGIVVNRTLVQGPNAIAGEWGHNPLPWRESAERPGPECYCGKQGCIETFLSGPGLSADHAHETGKDMTPGDIAEAAERGDVQARATMRRYVSRMARSLASVINLLDPHAIVLGGGLSNVDMLYDAVPNEWTRFVFSDRVATRLLRPAHGDSSGVRGAARLWPLPGDDSLSASMTSDARLPRGAAS